MSVAAAAEATGRSTSSSVFLGQVKDANDLYNARANNARSLSAVEVNALQSNGCRSPDWSQIRVAAGAIFNPAAVVNCFLGGQITFGTFDSSLEILPGISMPAGLYNSNITDVFVCENALIADTRLLAQSVVHKHAVVMGCGAVTCSDPTRFANGLELPVGVEVGGREVPCYADIAYQTAVAVGSNRADTKALADYSAAVEAYANHAHSNANVIRPNARLLNCPSITAVYIGDSALVDSSSLAEVTLLSEPGETSAVTGGASVRRSLIQWGCEVDSMACVEDSMLCEHSHVDRHGKLFDSFLGPNSGVSEGEVTSSFVGPFVGFHHQALLIACFWPSGKGNIGYGANVGSNHTLKAPDQELWPGEGLFFGLGVCIKYPSNFVRAPYSVVATGVTALPQTLAMPFSLINTPGEIIPGLSPAINEVTPAWVLSDAQFSVLRNNNKFATRNKARRTSIPAEVLRADTVDMMLAARAALAAAEPAMARYRDARGGAVFTDKEVKGIGKNYMKEASRVKAVATYTFFIRHYALMGMYRRLATGLSTAASIFDDASAAAAGDAGGGEWSHQLQVLQAEAGGSQLHLPSLLQELARSQQQVATSAEQSKARDDVRGQKIIDDYALVHKAPAEEKVVIEANRLAEEIASFAAASVKSKL